MSESGSAATLICPIHKASDCSPLLNGCSWLTQPATQIRRHEGAELVLTRDRKTRTWTAVCNGMVCRWGVESSRKSRAAIEAAHAEHLAAVARFAEEVDK